MNYMDKNQVLQSAAMSLNFSERPWKARVEGDSIIATWKWDQPEFFSPFETGDDTKEFTFVVTLKNNGTWTEADTVQEKSSGVSFSGGNLSFGSSKNTFKGKTNQKSFQFGIGKDKDGQVGIVGSKFDTSMVKEPIRAYLTNCGWKKAGLFG